MFSTINNNIAPIGGVSLESEEGKHMVKEVGAPIRINKKSKERYNRILIKKNGGK